MNRPLIIPQSLSNRLCDLLIARGTVLNTLARVENGPAASFETREQQGDTKAPTGITLTRDEMVSTIKQRLSKIDEEILEIGLKIAPDPIDEPITSPPLTREEEE